MTKTFSIRPLVDGDYADWKVLYSDYGKVWNEPFPENRLRKVWDFLIKPEFSAHGIVICNENSLIGFAHYMIYPCTYSTKMTCYLQDLYVLPSFRGKGLGQELIQYIADLGKQNDWRWVHWKTRASNLDAQKSYDKFAAREDYIHYLLNLNDEKEKAA